MQEDDHLEMIWMRNNVTGVKKEGKLVSNAVRKGGHVAVDPGERKIRKGTRLRKENIQLKDYV